MKLHILGSAGYHPNNDRHTACLMIPELGIVFDAGTAFFRVRDLIQTSELHIFLSHAHLDHCVGLSYFIDVLYEKDVKRVCVYGEAEKLEAIRRGVFSELLFPVQPPFEWIDIATEPVMLPNGCRMQPFPLVHPGGSLGFRLEYDGKSLAYVTDTTATPDAQYMAQVRDVDLLIHECHFNDGFEALAGTTGHSCLTPAAQLAASVNAGRLVLTHINPLDGVAKPLDIAVAHRIFPNTAIASDSMQIDW